MVAVPGAIAWILPSLSTVTMLSSEDEKMIS